MATTKFDRGAFDRVSSGDSFSIEVVSIGDLKSDLMVLSPLQDIKASGKGDLATGLVMAQDVSTVFDGSSRMRNSETVLRTDMASNFNGHSILDIGSAQVRTPFNVVMGGEGKIGKTKMTIYQNVAGDIRSYGGVGADLLVATELMPFRMTSGSGVDAGVRLDLPIPAGMAGAGDMELRRLGILNENIIELIGTEIAPGQSVTIDTDLLQVLIGAVEDVSSVTTDSVFFELSPGENEITIQTDGGETLEVVAIWQNRWL